MTENELSLLEASLKSEGCRNPLVVWAAENILLDGHNRLEICKRHNIAYRTKAIPIRDRATAKEWIEQNQLGRRNLTRDQFRMILGRYYNRVKRPIGGQKRDPENLDQPRRKRTTAHRLGKEFGVSHDTVEKAGTAAAIIDSKPEIARKVMRGEASMTQAVKAITSGSNVIASRNYAKTPRKNPTAIVERSVGGIVQAVDTIEKYRTGLRDDSIEVLKKQRTRVSRLISGRQP